jgi:uncharacterized protein YPO0396
MVNRDEVVEKMKRKLDAWNAEMDVLEEKIKNSKADLSVKYKAQLAELREKSRDMEKVMGDLRDGAEDTLDKLKEKTEKITEAFKDSFAEFKSHFD